MLGFVGDANSKAKLAEAREALVATQAAATEYGAMNPTDTTIDWSDISAKVTTLVNSDFDLSNISAVTIGSNGKVSALTYATSGYKYVYDGTKFTTSKS